MRISDWGSDVCSSDLKKWHQRNRTKLDRAKAPHQQARGMRQRLRAALDKFGVVRQIFRQGYLRHRSLMMEALLNPLKRSHQIEKRLVVLARDDAPVGKAAAVHNGLDTQIHQVILTSSTPKRST